MSSSQLTGLKFYKCKVGRSTIAYMGYDMDGETLWKKFT